MREQYMEELKKALEHVNPEIEKEILEDFQAHFEMGLEEGKTEEELAEELGDPAELAKQLEEEYGRFEKPETVSERAPEEYEDTEGKIKAIKLDMVVADITISPSTDGVFRVSYENSASGSAFNKRIRYSAHVSGDTFVAREETAHNSGRCWASMEIEIPREFTRLEVESTSGDIEIEGIRVREESEVSTLSGETTIEGLETGDLRVRTTSGGIRCEQVKAATIRTGSISGDLEFEELDCRNFSGETTSGDISIEGNVRHACVCKSISGDCRVSDFRGESLEVATTSGDLEVALGEGTGFTVLAETMSGDVEMDFGRKESKGFVGAKYRGVIGDGAARVRLKTLSGDIRVE